MPKQLRNDLLGDFLEPEDVIKVWNHPCELQKTTVEDAGKWTCKGLTYGENTYPCLSKEKYMHYLKAMQGWMCPRGDYCEAKHPEAKGEYTHFALCIECLRTNHLIDELPLMLWNYHSQLAVKKKVDACKYHTNDFDSSIL